MSTHEPPSHANEASPAVPDPTRMMAIALNSIEDFAYVFDREGRFVYSSQFLLRLLGISLDEIVGKNFFDLNYPNDLAARLQRQIQEVFDTGQIIRDETPFTSPTGVNGNYEYIFNPVFGADGAVEWVAGSTRDITRRTQAEAEKESLLQQLKAEQEKLHYLFEKAPAFVATLSGPTHIFERTNHAFQQLVGHRTLVGKTVREALPEVEGQGFIELLDGVYNSGQPYTGRELPLQLQLDPGGPLSQRFVDFVYQPIYDVEGAVTGIFAHGVDITEQVHARREAEAANRAKDEFLATLSHELRSPLAAIMGWTNILLNDQNSPEEIALGLNTIARNARAQSQLIEDILDVTRMIAGKMRLELQTIDLYGITGEVISASLPTAQAKRIELVQKLEDGELQVSGDTVRLQQIVRNLLSNALKFTPEGGRVEVSLRRCQEFAELEITDSGIGIAPEMLPYVFERFRQVDSSTTRAQSGLGLGLAIVRHLVELHGGSVEAHSQGLGQGATFVVKFPLQNPYFVPEAGEEPHSAAASSYGPRLDGVHVLVVDDGEDIRAFLEVALEKCGARVTAVTSASEAFTVLQQERPDVLLSDIAMPGEDGFSLIKRVRALPAEQGGQIPAAALTAFARNQDREEVLRSGFQAHLSKPIDPTRLAYMIGDLVGVPGGPQ